MATLVPHFELAEKIGKQVEIEAGTVGELIQAGIAQFGEPFETALKQAAIVVNGRLINSLKGKKTPLKGGDIVWLVLPAAGG